VYFPNAGYVSDPQLAAHNLQIAAENAGARFIFNTEVTEICLHEGRVQGLKIADGELFNAPVVVNVGGPNSNQINNMAGVTKGMRIANRPLKKEMCYLPAPANIGFSEDVPFFADPDIGSFCRPEVGGKLLTVSMEPKCDELTWVEDANNYDRNFTDQWTTQALRLGIRMPSLGIPGQASGIVDLYDVSTDWIPIYDVSDVKGYFMACGTSGNQFKNAPLAGAIITALIEATELGHNHDTDPVQLFLPRTGNTLNLGAFSRRRKINEESSLSVMG
jgi:sarcosine oxidase subunit beta